jgi:hypothetical protein
MTSFLLSADINEGGKFELTAPISVKGKKKRKIYQYYNIEFLGNQFEKLMEVSAVERSFEEDEVQTSCEDERYEKYWSQKYPAVLRAKQNHTTLFQFS